METKNQVGNQVINTQELLAHYQGHRDLTRRTIEAFPESETFRFSIGGMRTFGDLIKELLAIGVPGIREIVTGVTVEFDDKLAHLDSKAALLQAWNKASGELNELWTQLDGRDLQEEVVTFGRYTGTVISSILYFIDNEIHHRAQAYVYLRALGIEPPHFWDRN